MEIVEGMEPIFRLSMTHLQLHQNTLTRCLRNRVQAKQIDAKPANGGPNEKTSAHLPARTPDRRFRRM
jgi:hypothetical protein